MILNDIYNELYTSRSIRADVRGCDYNADEFELNSASLRRQNIRLAAQHNLDFFSGLYCQLIRQQLGQH
jgi:hypothetical protein